MEERKEHNIRRGSNNISLKNRLGAVPNTEVQLLNWIEIVEDYKEIAISQSVISKKKAIGINLNLLENLDDTFSNG